MTSTSTQAQRVSVPAADRDRAEPARSSVTFRTRHPFGLGAVSGTMTVASGQIIGSPGTSIATSRTRPWTGWPSATWTSR